MSQRGICQDCETEYTGEADEYGYLDDCVCGGLVVLVVTQCNLCERTIPPAPFPSLCPRCEGAAREAGRQANEAAEQEKSGMRRATR